MLRKKTLKMSRKIFQIEFLVTLHIYCEGTNRQPKKQNRSWPRKDSQAEKGWMGILGVWGMQTVVFRMDGQWDPAV